MRQVIYYMLILIASFVLIMSILENGKPLPPPSPYPVIDVAAVKQKLQEANISPTPAQFWDTLKTEQQPK